MHSKIKGLVTSIERYAIHDGPGIRTIVFMKGCPLRCIWCSSPQTQNPYPEIAYYEEKCIECGSCLEICPENAIIFDKQGKKWINRLKCTNCGKCAGVCPTEALKVIGQFMTSEEVMAEICKDKLFYQKSGGGITISGGEPLRQAEFVKEVLCKCHEQGIHTTIETSGFVEWQTFRDVLRYVDLLFHDIKHMDPKKHKELTGVSNRLILENIRKIDQECDVSVILRFPLIPGINDSEENLIDLAKFITSLKRIDTLEVLPYHRLGEHEYKTLDKEYKLKGLEVPSDRCLQKVKKFIGLQGSRINVLGLIRK